MRKPDRLARSTRQILDTFEHLAERGIGLKIRYLPVARQTVQAVENGRNTA